MEIIYSPDTQDRSRTMKSFMRQILQRLQTEFEEKQQRRKRPRRERRNGQMADADHNESDDSDDTSGDSSADFDTEGESGDREVSRSPAKKAFFTNSTDVHCVSNNKRTTLEWISNVLLRSCHELFVASSRFQRVLVNRQREPLVQFTTTSTLLTANGETNNIFISTSTNIVSS